ncbi:MAG: flagellar motor protein MotB [Mariprofundaceae bacterium]|nr:flagellar motor protein MotB [Mariprofundaceae bacterium]
MPRQKKLEPEILPDPEAWMTTFADLISLMLTFFILLVSMSTLDKTGLQDISTYFTQAVSVLSSGAGTEISIISPLELQRIVTPRELMLAMRQNSNVVLKNSTLQHHVRSLIVRNKLYLRMEDAALFEDGSATLKKEHIQALRRLAKMLASSPGLISVNGHTDDRAKLGKQFSDPWSLSLARAASVLHILESEGVTAHRLSLAGYGPSAPVSTDATIYGREKNRRVDIVVYR